MKVCVTGGAGFIGSHLVDRLVQDGHEVSVLDNLCTGRLENLQAISQHIRLMQGDVRDKQAVVEAVGSAEVVFHQAALASVERSVRSPEEVTAVNVGGTLNVLLAARDGGARRVVFASSSSVYGDTPTLPKIETMPMAPRSPYAASKCAGEAYVAAFQGAYGLEGVATRYFNVYGPRQRPDAQYAAVIPLFVAAMRGGDVPTIQGDGEQTRDFTYISDVIEAVCAAATTAERPAGPYNIGRGDRTSINRLAKTIGDAIDFQARPVYGPARVGDVRDSLADIGSIQRWTGWAPRISLEEGVRLTVAAVDETPAVGTKAP